MRPLAPELERDLQAFDAHLRGLGYSAQTQRSTLKAVRQLARALEARTDVYALPARLKPLLQRFVDWAGCPAALGELQSAARAVVTAAKPEPRRSLHKRARRQVEARSFEDGEWLELVAVLQATALDDNAPGHVEALALWILGETGLRVGDLLRLRRSAVCMAGGVRARERIELEVKGGKTRTLLRAGAPEAWDRLAQVWPRVGGRNDPRPNVASVVTDSVDEDASSWGAAYKRLERAAKAYGLRAKVSGRVNLHRFRRTVGVQALRVTKGDVRAVQELLGHESYHTTLGYLDEAQPDRVAEVQAQVRAAFRNKKETP